MIKNLMMTTAIQTRAADPMVISKSKFNIIILKGYDLTCAC